MYCFAFCFELNNIKLHKKVVKNICIQEKFLIWLTFNPAFENGSHKQPLRGVGDRSPLTGACPANNTIPLRNSLLVYFLHGHSSVSALAKLKLEFIGYSIVLTML